MPSDADAALDAEALAALAAERRPQVRARLRTVAQVALGWHLLIFVVKDLAVYGSLGRALWMRGPQCVLLLGLLRWLGRTDASARRMMHVHLACVLVVLLHSGYSVTFIPESAVILTVASLVAGMIALALASDYDFGASLALFLGTYGIVGTGLAIRGPIARQDRLELLGALGLIPFLLVAASARYRERARALEFLSRRGLARVNDQLVRAAAARDRLFTHLAHDLRTPLAVILGESSLLRAQDGADPVALGRIAANAGAVSALVDDLLELARIDSGDAPCKPAAVATRPAVEALVARLDHGGQVTVTGASNAARVDPRHLDRIVSNLLANALRQRRADGSLARVELRLADGEGGVTLEVSDDGPGVPAARAAAVFERYQSFDRDGSSVGGIGLPLARELARLNGGDLELVTGAPRTTFRVRLPATAEAPPPPPATPGPAATAGPTRAGDGPAASDPDEPAEVLVVEDHPDLADLLRRALSPLGRVTLADTLRAAREALDRAPPAVIVSDRLLPDGTGDALVTAVRATERTRTIPIVFVSALGSVGDRVEGLAAGADDYLAKPFDVTELRARVARALQRREVDALDREAQRDELAAELHDGVCGLLARAAVLLDAHQRDAGPSARVAAARTAVLDALGEARELLSLAEHEAPTWDALGRELGEAFVRCATDAGLAARFDSTPAEGVQVPAKVAHALRRAAHEGLTNTIRHADARRVTLTLELTAPPRTARLRLDDDGANLPAAGTDRRGLTGLARRAARLHGALRFEPAPDRGSTLTVELPLDDAEASASRGSEGLTPR